MRKLFLALITVCFLSSFALAQEAAPASTTSDETVSIKGVIIDNMCAGSHKDSLDEFVKAHPKSCVLMPDCAASGFSIYTDGKLIKFDKASNDKIAEFLKKEDSKLEVVIIAGKAGEELSLVSIENQK